MKSIRRKLILSHLVVAAVTLVLTGSLLIITTRYIARQVERDSLQRTADDLLPRIQSILRSERDPDRVTEIIGLAESLGRIDVRFVGPDGEFELGSFLAERARRLTEEDPGTLRMMPPRPGMGRTMDRFLDGDATRMMDDREDIPAGTIRLRLAGDDHNSYLEITDRGDLADQVTRLTLIGFLLSALVTLGAAALISVAVGSSLTRPIVSLTRTVETMHEGDMHARVAVFTSDEIGTLGRRFNELAGRLSASFAALRKERDTLRNFMADASHELRTPLTAMTTHLELLGRESGGHGQEELLRELETQTRRMSRTVSDLLTLSRLDGGLADLASEPVDLPEVLRNAWSQASASRTPETLSFRIDDASDAARKPNGDERSLITLFTNLFENSLNATAAGGGVECSLSDAGDERIVRITDNGSGITPEELPLVFRRFYRSPRNQADGSGLGLSIAESIARAHGGTIAAASPPPGRAAGTEISVRLPLLPT